MRLLAAISSAAVLAAALAGCRDQADVAVRAPELSVLAETGQQVFDHSAFDEVLQQHVTDAGMVDYAALKADRARLDDYVGTLASASPASDPALFPTPEHQIAYWSNAYNALMMRAVIDHYPIDSVTEIKLAHGVFSRLYFPVGGKSMSLDDIEKGVLLEEFDEPRVHWVLTCASMSCPRIDQRALQGEGLSERLDEEARAFLRSSNGVRIDAAGGRVYLSKYFDWYGDDFGEPLAYVRRYLDDAARAQLDRIEDPEIELMEYDWRLNDAGASWAAR